MSFVVLLSASTCNTYTKKSSSCTLSLTSIRIFKNQLFPVSLLEEVKILKSASPMDYAPSLNCPLQSLQYRPESELALTLEYACSQHPVKQVECSLSLLGSTTGLVMKGGF